MRQRRCWRQHLAGILQLNLSNGFAIPPNVRPWPSIRRTWEEIDEQSSITAEQRLDRVTGAAQRMLGKMAPAPMRERVGAPPILDTFAELDHYQTRGQWLPCRPDCPRFPGTPG